MTHRIEQFAVTTEQMRTIEGRIFAAGMPVAALMEKVAGQITRRVLDLISELNPHLAPQFFKIGVLVGPGHNGGDALVVARELHFQGFQVVVYCPFQRVKELTGYHAQYDRSLGIPFYEEMGPLQDCNLLIDGLFGFGLEKELTHPVASAIDEVNTWKKTVISIDIPSGLHTDTGAVLGTAIRATYSLCLGLWKLAFLQEEALAYLGRVELVDFDIPLTDITAVLGNPPSLQRMTREAVLAGLPLPRPSTTHKYKNGHLLIVAGSRRYTGAAILAALGARASGVGMLSVAVPESIKPLLSAELPEALVLGCPETRGGGISQFPVELDLYGYDAIACGPGLTLEAAPIVESILESDRSLILDADGLNILAQLGTLPTLAERQGATVLTPHLGEFKRLFPNLANQLSDRITAVRQAAQLSGAVVLLKGARVAIANAAGCVWLNPESTPALARGGSGDVLTGLLGGLLAAAPFFQIPVESAVCTAAVWHARAGILATHDRTELGVDAFTLSQYLAPALQQLLCKTVVS